MAHFARIDQNSVVTEVLVIDQETINTGLFGDPNSFIQTSYNTHGGVHANGGTPLRKNYAAPGFVYDRARDAFIPPKPYASWILNEDTCLWEAPILYPDNQQYYTWDENSVSWVVFAAENN